MLLEDYIYIYEYEIYIKSLVRYKIWQYFSLNELFLSYVKKN